MLQTVLTLLSIYGVCFAIKDTKGLSVPRDWIRKHSVILDSMLDCAFCTGFWSGIIVHLITYKIFDIKDLFLYGFGAAALCYIVDTIMIKLGNSEESNSEESNNE